MKHLLLICFVLFSMTGFAQEQYFQADYGATDNGYAIHLKARNKTEFEKEKERCRRWALRNGRSKQQFESDAKLMDLDFEEWCKRNGIDDDGFHGTSSSEQRFEVWNNKVKENNSEVRNHVYGEGGDIRISQTVFRFKDEEDSGSLKSASPRQKTFKDVPRPALLPKSKNVTTEYVGEEAEREKLEKQIKELDLEYEQLLKQNTSHKTTK